MSPGEKYLAECHKAILSTSSYAKRHLQKPDPAMMKKRIEVEMSLAEDGTVKKPFRSEKVIAEEVETLYQARQKLVDEQGDSPLLFPFRLATKEFLAVARKAGMTLPHEPVVGVLPVGVMNAWTIAVPRSEDLVIAFHSGLGLYLNRMLKIVLALSAATDLKAYDEIGRKEGWQEKYATLIEAALSRDDTHEKHFVRMLVCYLAVGDPNLAPPIYLSEKYQDLRASILHYTEMYIAGHECAHLLLGHVKPDTRKIFRMLGEKEVSNFEWSWKDEYDADALSVALTSAHSAERFLEKIRPLHFMNIQGADFALSCAEVLDVFLNAIIGTPEKPSETHPPLAERRSRIRASLNSITGEADANYYGEEWRIILQLLVKRNRQAILSRFPNPETLSPVWKD